MDPCRFLRVVISNLAIRFPTNNPNLDSYFCKIKLCDFPSQSVEIPILPSDSLHPDSHSLSGSSCFTLTRPDIETLVAKNSSKKPSKRPAVKIDVYSRKSSGGICGFGSSGKLLGRVVVPVELTQQAAEGKASMVLHKGWVVVGGERKRKGEVYLSVRVNPDPRFVFEFGSGPEFSPQVFQVQGGSNIKQPVFSCKFSHRNSGESSSENDQRKGWSITIHDLSGSPVAAASMVTPFVPSPGSDRVSRASPGGWLILRPGDGTWKPWGRLEAWQDHDQPNRVGYRFDLSHDIADGLTLAQGTLPARPGGKFTIDVTDGVPSPSVSPNSSVDFGSGSGSGSGSSSSSGSECGWWAGLLMYKGFVMSSTVGERGGKAEVEVGAQHVTCTEDAAVFVALAAAMDLSMDACKPFSHKLRKELRQPSGEFVV